MTKKPVFILSILAALLVLQVGLLCLSFEVFHHHRPGPEAKKERLLLRTFYEGPTIYDSFYSAGASQVIEPEREVVAGIIPHHLIVGDKIAAFFLGLEKEDYDTVILLSPNHFNLTSKRIMISGVDWQTPYGRLETDEPLARSIASSTGFLYLEDGGLAREHGVNYETPFIKRSFPDAKLVAVIIKKEAKKDDLDRLALAIGHASSGKRVLVLASIDFSHDLTADQADAEDKVSNEVIGGLSLERYEEIRADCPAAVYAAMKYASLSGAQEPRLLWNTNSSRLIDRPQEAGVSHNFYYFLR